VAREKTELASRSEKLTSERDRLIKERTSVEKQLRETELKLKEGVDKVDCTALLLALTDSVHFIVVIRKLLQ